MIPVPSYISLGTVPDITPSARVLFSSQSQPTSITDMITITLPVAPAHSTRKVIVDGTALALTNTATTFTVAQGALISII